MQKVLKKRPRVKKVKASHRWKTHRSDHFFPVIIFLFLLIGIAALFSASSTYAQDRFLDSYYFLKRQILFGLAPGLALGTFFYFFPLALTRKVCALIFGGTLLFTLLVFFPSIGVTVAGASRWIAVGFIQFQPSEFLKVGYILYAAALLSQSQKHGETAAKSGKFFPFMAISGLAALPLVFQPDIGTLAILAASGAIIYFVSGAPLSRIAIAAVVLILCAAILLSTTSYRAERLAVFLNPKTDPLGIGYHINQILIAIGSGGLTGAGLGMSQQKFGFIPQPIGDSIFAVFSEEFGFIGSMLLITLMLLFLWRGILTARHAPEPFMFLVCVGITSWVALQAFANIAAMAGLIPLTGVPLPFFSYGGSAMTAILAGMGIVLNISRHTV